MAGVTSSVELVNWISPCVRRLKRYKPEWSWAPSPWSWECSSWQWEWSAIVLVKKPCLDNLGLVT